MNQTSYDWYRKTYDRYVKVCNMVNEKLPNIEAITKQFFNCKDEVAKRPKKQQWALYIAVTIDPTVFDGIRVPSYRLIRMIYMKPKLMSFEEFVADRSLYKLFKLEHISRKLYYDAEFVKDPNITTNVLEYQYESEYGLDDTAELAKLILYLGYKVEIDDLHISKMMKSRWDMFCLKLKQKGIDLFV